MIVDAVAALAAGYLIGSIPVAAWIARGRGRDVFQLGSGNMGAMNVARNLGWGAGVLVLIGDAGKGAGAVLLGSAMAQWAGTVDPLPTSLAAGTGAVLGHAWSCFAGLRGGKALATLFGMFLPVAPLAAGYGLAVLVALVLLLRRTTLAAVIALLAFPFVTGTAVTNAGWVPDRAFAVATAAAAGASISIVKHLLAARRPPPGATAPDDTPR